MTHSCMKPGCNMNAEMLPRLVVPSHPMSIKPYTSQGSVMSWPVCQKHFGKLSPSEFLGVDDVRRNIENEFRELGAIPDLKRATLAPVRKASQAFRNWESAMRAGMQDESRKAMN